MRRWKGVAVTAATVALVVPPTAANAADDGNHGGDDTVSTVAEGLSGPRQVDEYRGDRQREDADQVGEPLHERSL